MPRVYVAVGSNVEAGANVARALAGLRARFPGLIASRAYRNAAVGFSGEDFVNLVVGFDTELDLAGLIAELHRIEADCGRRRDDPKWGPRRMDLDLLLYGDQVLDSAAVRLPRPDLLKRAYMLGPLAELAPQLEHPSLRRPIGELWREFGAGRHPLTPIELPP